MSNSNQKSYTKLNITIKPLNFSDNFTKNLNDKNSDASVGKFNDNLTALTLFSPLAQMPWAIWLDSCQSDHVDSRYDIIVWQPSATLTTYGDTTQIQWFDQQNKNDNVENSDEDPLILVKKIQQEVFSTLSLPSPCDLPFIGGALGYFSYDLGRRFENLPDTAQQDITLADMAVGIYTHAIVVDNKTQQSFLICPEPQRKTLTHELAQKLLTTQKNNDHSEKESTGFQLNSPWQSNMSRAEYGDKFQRVQSYLRSGDCYQINLTQRFSAQYQGDEFTAYQALRASNQAPFSAFMCFEKSAVLSISPERFLQVKNNKVQSKPIKGTLTRSEDPVKDQANAQTLKHSIKDQAENVMIVDLLRNDISKVCQAGSVVVPTLFEIESFPAVHHLVSTVEGTLAENFAGSDLLRAAFPGGSITGAPKIRAMEIIEELEPHHRSVYCGSIGYLSACGNMDTNITIRTLICENNKIYCSAGGGLVADSKVDDEYQETFDKVQCILPILNELT